MKRRLLDTMLETALVTAVQIGTQQVVQQANSVCRLPGRLADLEQRVERLEATARKPKKKAS